MADYADIIEARIRTERGDLDVIGFALDAMFSAPQICDGCGTHSRFHAIGCPAERQELDAAVRSDREMETGERNLEPGVDDATSHSWSETGND